MYHTAYRKIEHYLYLYNRIEVQIDVLKSEIRDSEFNQNYTRFIKNKSSSLEDLIISNDNLNKRIDKILKWQELITEVLNYYQKNDRLKYKFLVWKYFKKVKDYKIQEKLNLSYEDAKDMQAEIVQYIFFCAVQKNMLKEESIYAKENTGKNPEIRTTKEVEIRKISRKAEGN